MSLNYTPRGTFQQCNGCQAYLGSDTVYRETSQGVLGYHSHWCAEEARVKKYGLFNELHRRRNAGTQTM